MLASSSSRISLWGDEVCVYSLPRAAQGQSHSRHRCHRRGKKGRSTATAPCSPLLSRRKAFSLNITPADDPVISHWLEVNHMFTLQPFSGKEHWDYHVRSGQTSSTGLLVHWGLNRIRALLTKKKETAFRQRKVSATSILFIPEVKMFVNWMFQGK